VHASYLGLCKAPEGGGSTGQVYSSCDGVTYTVDFYSGRDCSAYLYSNASVLSTTCNATSDGRYLTQTCVTAALTPTPTLSPTPIPTPAPSLRPSLTPSHTPSSMPTWLPSSAPSAVFGYAVSLYYGNFDTSCSNQVVSLDGTCMHV
jgi:hypothetical protein